MMPQPIRTGAAFAPAVGAAVATGAATVAGGAACAAAATRPPKKTVKRIAFLNIFQLPWVVSPL
jgi:hypothetical protein